MHIVHSNLNANGAMTREVVAAETFDERLAYLLSEGLCDPHAAAAVLKALGRTPGAVDAAAQRHADG